MKWGLVWRIAWILGLIAVFVFPISVSAGNVVTVTMNPLFTGGINSFTITYVTDTQMDLDWTYGGDTANVMVRAKYGNYPANIPNQFTTPSDGYLVYYGSGLSASDTSMNFDQNPGYLYYMAWAQRGDGTWHLDVSSGKEESKQLILIAMIISPLAIMGLGWRFKQAWLLWLACPFWVILGIYIAYNETWFPTDAQRSLILIGVIGTIGCIFAATHMNLGEMEKEGTPEGKGFYDDWGGDEMDDDDKEALAEHKRYSEQSKMYHTKTKKRLPKYLT